MAKDLKGTQTEKNLMTAFAGESEARNKYTYFASVAKKQGFEQVAGYFQETADNEKEHAELWFKLLGGIGDTESNLKAAAEGENYEWTDMYAKFAQIARSEGFEDIAKTFEGVGNIEKRHQERFEALLKNIQDGTVFKRPQEALWQCRNCGHVLEGTDAPDVCPVCAHAKSYFQLYVKNY